MFNYYSVFSGAAHQCLPSLHNCCAELMEFVSWISGEIFSNPNSINPLSYIEKESQLHTLPTPSSSVNVDLIYSIRFYPAKSMLIEARFGAGFVGGETAKIKLNCAINLRGFRKRACPGPPQDHQQCFKLMARTDSQECSLHTLLGPRRMCSNNNNNNVTGTIDYQFRSILMKIINRM